MALARSVHAQKAASRSAHDRRHPLSLSDITVNITDSLVLTFTMEKAARSPKSSLILAALIAAMILLLALNVVQSYAGLEGFSFWGYPYVRSFFEDPDNPIKMKKISCPPFIGLDESKLVSVSLTNTANRNVNAFFQAVVSSPDSEYGAVHIIREVPLQRGETRIETVEITLRIL